MTNTQIENGERLATARELADQLREEAGMAPDAELSEAAWAKVMARLEM